MKQPFRGATNQYLADYLRNVVGEDVDTVEGNLPSWLPCPVCGYHTFEIIGDWDTCTVCGWNSDPVQEAMPDDPTGANGISLNAARKNFEQIGAITPEKLKMIDPEMRRRFPRST
ncbi:MAG: hypothetical protein D6768_16345 [Chloroflexi bacterium]|nr:MAG: hypothetical protein D6768_16345 [Chloroflexota bacterium]